MKSRRTVVSLFSGIEGFGYAMERAGCELVYQVENDPFCLAVLRSHWPTVPKHNDIRTFGVSLPAYRARMSALPAAEPDSPGNAQDSFTSLRASCESFDPLGLCSRMFPDFSVQTVEETLRKSSAFSWPSAGMGFAGACSIASFSESPSAAAGCSLSDVLESRVPPRFFLSARAAAGILRRAARRGRILPTHLQKALEELAARGATTARTLRMASENPMGTTDEAAHTEMDATTSSHTTSLGVNNKDKTTLTNPRGQEHFNIKEIPQAAMKQEQSSSTRSVPPACENPTDTTDEAVHAETDATTSSQGRSRHQATTESQRKMPQEMTSSPTRSVPPATTRATPQGEGERTISISPTVSEKTLAESDKATTPPTLLPGTCETEVKGQPTTLKQLSGAETEEMNSTDTERMSVRRLTPTECETLQGFPKGWTVPDIGLWAMRSPRK